MLWKLFVKLRNYSRKQEQFLCLSWMMFPVVNTLLSSVYVLWWRNRWPWQKKRNHDIFTMTVNPVEMTRMRCFHIYILYYRSFKGTRAWHHNYRGILQAANLDELNIPLRWEDQLCSYNYIKYYWSNKSFKIFVNCQIKLSAGVHSESTWSTF